MFTIQIYNACNSIQEFHTPESQLQIHNNAHNSHFHSGNNFKTRTHIQSQDFEFHIHNSQKRIR